MNLTQGERCVKGLGFRLGFLWTILCLAFSQAGLAASLNDFRVEHCKNCGDVLVGAAKIEHGSVQWIGAQSAMSISIAGGGSFGFTGDAKYRAEAVVDNQWNFETATSFTIGGAAPNGGAPSMGFYFSPDQEGEFQIGANYIAMVANEPPMSFKSEVFATGIADDVSNPALQLGVKVSDLSVERNNVKVEENQVKLPIGGNVIFEVTPRVEPTALPEGIDPVQYVIVDLFAVEDNTNCASLSVSFRGGPKTPNQFAPESYFQYLYEVGRDITPNNCRYQVSFIASVNQTFEFQTQNQRDTDGGSVSYTFAIRGHMDFSDIQKWPSSHETFYLTTTDEVQRTPPEAIFEITQRGNLTATLSASKSSASLGGIQRFAWSSTDAAIEFANDTGINTEIRAASAGIYPITLEVTDAFGVSGQVEQNIQLVASNTPAPVTGSLNASFTIDPNPAYQGQEILLDATPSTTTSDATITKYAWSSDLFSTLIGAQQRVTFNQEGDHAITLTVTDSNDQQHSVTRIVSVSAVEGLQALFSLEPGAKGVMPYKVRFNANASHAPLGMNIDRFTWFIDGVELPKQAVETITIGGENPQTVEQRFATEGWRLDEVLENGKVVVVTFTQAGNYGVFLKVEDTVHQEVDTLAHEVKVVEDEPPVAEFSVTTGAGRQSLQFFADASASHDPDTLGTGTDGIRYYLWQWQTIDGQNADYVLTQQPATQLSTDRAGVYTLTLTVIDDEGDQHQTSQFLWVNRPIPEILDADGVRDFAAEQALAREKVTTMELEYPSLGVVRQINPDGVMAESVASSQTLRGGVLQTDTNLFAESNATLSAGSAVDIFAELDVAAFSPFHQGDFAEALVLVAFAPLENPLDRQFFMRAPGVAGFPVFVPWDSNPANLTASFQTTLSEKLFIPVYQGPLLVPGTLQIFTGYRLLDGTLVFGMDNPISLQVQ